MSQPATIPLDEVDLSDIDRFARDEGWAQFDTLRREAPVHWNPESNASGFWSVTRHADICAVDRDPEVFTSTKFVGLEEGDEDLMEPRRSMLEMDGVRLNLADVKIPIYIQSSKEDHIAPAESVLYGSQFFGGPVKYVLSGSGHIVTAPGRLRSPEILGHHRRRGRP